MVLVDTDRVFLLFDLVAPLNYLGMLVPGGMV